MARPIADTPVLRGQDAIRFMEAMENVKPVSKKKKKEMEKDWEWAKAHATFPL